MKLLETINQNDFEPQNYTVRKVVRAVIFDRDKNNILFFGGSLVGGGVESGETDEDALIREAKEEVGAKIEIIQELGETVAYRDLSKLKYIVHGYLCIQLGDFEAPTTTDPDEQEQKIEWIEKSTAIKRLEEEIDSFGKCYLPHDDIFQVKVHNRKTQLAFLKEV